MAAESTEEGVGGGAATEELDSPQAEQSAAPLTRADVREVVDEALSETDAPLTYEESRKAARVGMLQAAAIIAALLLAIFGVHWMFTGDNAPGGGMADIQNDFQWEILAKYELGGESRGISYIPPGPFLITHGESAYGLYYVKPKLQTCDWQAMGVHLLLRAAVNWREHVPDSIFKREMIGTPKLLYENGVPAAAYVFYRHVEKGSEKKRPSDTE